MGLQIDLPKVMTTGSVVSDLDASKIVPMIFRAELELRDSGMHILPRQPDGEIAILKRPDESMAYIPVARNYNVAEEETVMVGYTSDRDFVGGIVRLRRKATKKIGTLIGAEDERENLGLFQPLDVDNLRYLYEPRRQSMVADLIRQLQERPDLFLMMRETLETVGLQENERVEVRKVSYVNPIGRMRQLQQKPISQRQMLQLMPHLPEFEGRFPQ